MIRPSTRLVVIPALVVSILAVAAVLWPGHGSRPLTVHFRSVTGLHEGDEVRVIGVKLGHVESITATPSDMRVVLRVPDDLVLPANVKAAIVPPNLVSGRFVELAPAYVSGPRLAADAEIGTERAGVPVEWDDVKDQLTRLSEALGPNGVNADGMLGDAVVTADENLHGVAGDLRTTMEALATTTDTLADSGDDLFATIRHLERLARTLRSSDADVRRFTVSLAGASDVLADNRKALADSITLLEAALSDITTFVKDNKGRLGTSLLRLERLAAILAGNVKDMAALLHVLPAAFGNFYNVIDPRFSSVTGALAVDNVRDFGQVICGAVISTGQPVAACKQALAPLIAFLQLNNVSIPGSFLPESADLAPAAPATAAPVPGPTAPLVTDPVDQIGPRLQKLLGVVPQ